MILRLTRRWISSRIFIERGKGWTRGLGAFFWRCSGAGNMVGVKVRLYLLSLSLIALASVGVAWWLWSPVLGPYPFGVPRPPAPAARVSAAAARVYATTLPAIGFERLGIADALDRLREGSGVSIFVNWRALAASGINKDAAVSLHPPTGDLGTTLRALLDQVEASHPGT